MHVQLLQLLQLLVEDRRDMQRYAHSLKSGKIVVVVVALRTFLNFVIETRVVIRQFMSFICLNHLRSLESIHKT